MSAPDVGPVRREWNGFLLALGFLSRLPVLRFARYSDEEFGRCARWFVPVGVLLGTLALLPSAVLLKSSAWVAVWTTLGVSLLITGAFHEDGLADTFDGLGGGLDREQKLAIMKDSRLGTYGAAALFVSLQLRAAALVAIGPMWPVAFVTTQGVSRAPAVALMALLPEARHAEGKPKPNADRDPAPAAWIGLAFAVLVTVVAVWIADLAWCWILVAAVLCALLMRSLLRRQIGGYTGDALGATQQLTEVVAYVGLVAIG